MALNHYAINQVVRGKMVPGGRFRFGRFGLPKVAGSLLKHQPRPGAKVTFDLDTDRLVFDAFVRASEGASPETVLIDPALASRFHSIARRLGVHAPDADLNRRLLNIRKNKARYSKHGIIIPPATKVTPHPSVVPRYAHVIEFSLARLHSRYGVSIDDILIDPDLAAEYEAMASAAAPGLSSLELRLAALYIRKTRFIAGKDAGIVQSLDPERLESAFVEVGSVNSLKLSAVPGGEGMVEILEHNRHLYVSRNEDLRAAVDQIVSPSSVSFMSNEFWHPNPEELQIRVFAGHQFMKVSLSQWQLKLISEKKPVFNWPVTAKTGGSGPKRQRAA